LNLYSLSKQGVIVSRPVYSHPQLILWLHMIQWRCDVQCTVGGFVSCLLLLGVRSNLAYYERKGGRAGGCAPAEPESRARTPSLGSRRLLDVL